MTRYFGNTEWLDADQQVIAVGPLGAPAPTGVMPLTSLVAVNLTPSRNGGVLVMDFAHTNQPSVRLAVPYGAAGAESFSALYQWLVQVISVNRKLDSRALNELVIHAHQLALRYVSGDDSSLPLLVDDVRLLRTHMQQGKLDGQLWPVVASAIEVVFKDETISADDEARLDRLVDVLGLAWEYANRVIPQECETMVIGRINDGRLPEIDPSGVPLVAKHGEVIHGDFSVGLMREQFRTEFQGGSNGISIPLGHGLRLRSGRVRGHTVTLGKEIVAVDSGRLVVTSLRAVYAGTARTLEFDYSKLASLQAYSDALALGVSNRQTTSLFRFDKGESPMIAAALITRSAGAARE